MKTMPYVIKFKSRGPKWHPGPPGGERPLAEKRDSERETCEDREVMDRWGTNGKWEREQRRREGDDQGTREKEK